MKDQIRNINNKAITDRFENDQMSAVNDLVLFDTIGEYMKGWLDLEDVKNDPALSIARGTVENMISDYNKNIAANKENEKFIRESLSDKKNTDSVSEEIKNIRKEIADNRLNEITSEWVKDWHEKKQRSGINDTKTEEIRNFISSSIDSPEKEPLKFTDEDSNNVFRRSLFARYTIFSAAALLGAFLLIRTLLPSSDPGKLFDSYYKPFDAISPVTRSINNIETDSYSSAIESYKTGNYQEAAILFAGIMQKDTKAGSAQFFLGLSQLANNNFNQAINLLTGVANDSGEYGKEAKWYLGLTYLKTANKQKAAECFEYLARSNGFYRERSEEILRRLR
jgi:TolA-binding protein